MNEKKMTRKEFEEKVRDLAKLIQEKTVAFADDNPIKEAERKRHAKDNVLFFAQTYFPHYITAEFADWHVEEIQKLETALDTNQTQIVSEIWFRGSGKSSLLIIAFFIWAGVTKRSYFNIISGADKELSKERTVAIRLEFQYNARLRNDYPDAGMDPGTGEEYDFETPTGVRYLALGYKQAIRGKIHGRHRPRLIGIDDLESHKDTNPQLSKKKYEYVTEEAFGAFGLNGGLLLWLGNLTNSTGALNRFVEKCDTEPNEFESYRIIKALDDNGESNWPSAYSTENLLAKQKVMGKIGFDRHYMMKPTIDGEVFKEEWIRFYNPFGRQSEELLKSLAPGSGLGFELPTRQDLMEAPKVTFTDPSMGAGETNDYKAIWTVALWRGIYWLLNVEMMKCTIIEMIEAMYDVDQRYLTRMYMEDIFWQKLIRDYLPQVALKRGYVLPLRGFSPRLKKEERILTLQPLFQFGNIINCTTGKAWSIFKEQLIGFPNANYDDGPDALASAIEMFKYISASNVYETVERSSKTMIY